MGKVLSAFMKRVPKPVRSTLKPAYLATKCAYLDTLDLFDVSTRRREMIPPRKLRFVGDGDFKAIGLEFRRIFVEVGGLKPDDRVLEIGSGIGRMAAPLAEYLSAKGGYQGLEIVKKGVEWCQDNITTRHPNLQFRHADVYNTSYNPQGIIQAARYEFPYEDNYFDFVFLTSVFTHMFPADMENYLNEISRVLRKSGTCLITFFLLNGESEDGIRRGKSTQDFTHEIDGCFTMDVRVPERGIAFSEAYVRGLFRRLNLSIEEPIRYGSRCGRERFVSYQDIVIARKE